jgi:oligogalacturonide lyase
MKMIRLPLLFVLMGALLLPTLAAQKTPAPTPTQSNTWIDAATGHRVIRLTSQPESSAWYFNNNVFTSDGQMIYDVLDPAMGGYAIYALNLTTFQSKQLVAAPTWSGVVAHKSPFVYFTRPKDTGIYSVNTGTGVIAKIGERPPRAEINTINADDTLLAGTYTEVEPPQHPDDKTLNPSQNKAKGMVNRLNDHVPMTLFTVNVETGKVTPILHSTDWLNHPNFSPTDPTLLMYSHEGPWEQVDRIWTIRADGSDNKLIHQRTVNGEIAGHEFWDADGKTIWYDLQIPRGQNFYLASYNTETKARRWYAMGRDDWSIHFNVNNNGLFFCGSGAGEGNISRSKNARWINLYLPVLSPPAPGIDQSKLVQSGHLETQHLVSMAKQLYLDEPNVRFSPDQNWVIFNADFTGPSYIYAVEIAKGTPVTPTAPPSTPTPAGGK